MPPSVAHRPHPHPLPKGEGETPVPRPRPTPSSGCVSLPLMPSPSGRVRVRAMAALHTMQRHSAVVAWPLSLWERVRVRAAGVIRQLNLQCALLLASRSRCTGSPHAARRSRYAPRVVPEEERAETVSSNAVIRSAIRCAAPRCSAAKPRALRARCASSSGRESSHCHRKF